MSTSSKPKPNEVCVRCGAALRIHPTRGWIDARRSNRCPADGQRHRPSYAPAPDIPDRPCRSLDPHEPHEYEPLSDFGSGVPIGAEHFPLPRRARCPGRTGTWKPRIPIAEEDE